MKTLMYAELLANIRQISVIAALESPCDSSTKIELSPNRQQILLHHGGEASVLQLPGQTVAGIAFERPVLGSTELSWRLPLAGQLVRGDAESNDSPWPAVSLGKDTQFLCRGCDSVVVEQGVMKTWKDLPSENWAEMMDFWHCHKPSDHASKGANGHSHPEHSTASRGYGANSKVVAQSSVGFVDLTTLLLTQSDCIGIKKSAGSRDSSQYRLLACENCENYIGHTDQHAEGYRLYKWRLKTSENEPSMASIVTAQLQSIILAQCSSRLLLVPVNQKHSSQTLESSKEKSVEGYSAEGLSLHCTSLSLWVLSSSIRYSTTKDSDVIISAPTSNSQSSSGRLAMKIFWKALPDPVAEKLLEGNGVEEVSLPAEAILEIRENLRRTSLFLPPSGRKFQDWDVGLLERFEK